MAATAEEVKEGLEKLHGDFNKTSKVLTELVEKQDEEIKRLGGTTTATSTQIKSMEENLMKIGQDMKGLQVDFTAIQEKLNQHLPKHEDEQKTIGQRFTESKEYKESYHSKGGQVRNSESLVVKSFYPQSMKSITGSADLRTIMATTRLMEIMADPLRRQRVRDLLPVIPTGNSSIDFIRETLYTNAAAAVEEGELKPETSLTFEQESTSVKTLAHWVPITRQLSTDIPALMGYIDSRLIQGLKLVEDAELLYGDNTGAHLQGIMNTPNVQTYAWSAGQASDTKIDAIRRAITKVTISQYSATGIVLAPLDWEDIELTKDSQNRYIWAVVNDSGVKRLWALPVVETTAMQPGDFLTGAFDMAAAIWDREEANIRIADQHADYFIRNMLVALCEERLGLTVYRPSAFVVGAFDNAPES